MNVSEAEAMSMRTRLAQLEQDVQILAKEVRARRKLWYAEEDDDESLQRLVEEAESYTNQANVLNRISE